MKRLFLFVCLLGSAISAFGQRTISGKVTDSGGEALIGANVVAKGTEIGTVTDIDGSYSINVPGEVTILTFTYTGFTPKDVVIGNASELNVIMEEGVAIQEVVVTALGIQREKRALGYSVTTVDKKLIEERPQTDVGRILQGKVPGVNINGVSGISGTGTNINIRGYTSISGNTQPLFVVDGVPYNSNTNAVSTGGGSATQNFTTGGQSTPSRFIDIDPNNIENVSVLKGLAATVLYGDQGRNGVILITTKTGNKKFKAPSISLSTSLFGNQVAALPEYQNLYGGGFQQVGGPAFFSNWGAGFHQLKETPHPYSLFSSAELRAAFPEFQGKNVAYTGYKNNVSDFFRTGLVTNNSLVVNGGTDKFNYSASLGYANEEGYIENNDLNKLNIGLGTNVAISDKISFSTSLQFSSFDQKTPPISGGQANNALDYPSIFANLFFTNRSNDLTGWPFESPVDNRSVYYRAGNDIPNPYWIRKYERVTDQVNRLFSSSIINYKITPRLDLSYKVGLDTYGELQELIVPKGDPLPSINTGLYRTANIDNTIWDHTVALTYQKPFSKSFGYTVKVGGNMRNDFFRQDAIISTQQLAFNLNRHSNFLAVAANDFTIEQTRMGIFGNAIVDYKEWVYLDLAGRYDWTSTVEKENRTIFYPSASVSFIPTSLFKGLESTTLGYLKLRFGVGQSAGFPNPYNTRNVLAQNARAFTDASGTLHTTHSVANNLGNPNLKPELHSELEFGVEARMLRNRVSIDLTVYNRTTKDLITSALLDPSTGFTNTTINIGKLRNKGIELGLSGSPVKVGNFEWETFINYSRNQPLIEELSNSLTSIQIAGFGSALGNYAEVGQPFNVIKGTKWRTNEQGQRLIDAGGNFLVTATPEVMGDPNPKFLTSFGNTLVYKNLALSAMLEYRHGGVIYSSMAKATLGRGTSRDTEFDRDQTFILPGVKASDGTPNDVQITASDVYFNNVFFFGDEGSMYDGTQLKLREVSLSYTVPAKLLGKTIKGASLTLSGNNLWNKAFNFPKYMNFDADMAGLGVGNGIGFDMLVSPTSKRFGGSLKLTF
ncbi:MAG TPA: SusC/RagA family TonB-linked outer membrane protein [Saprospiraceae bacterium]|nr:SusC/RagA family TonB-linked outer membrane protein [Saprospiraceae bacterium]HNT20132.1 SusC/RagA family TonB-linked outer membrane protein [Saprospiraceae bacterium]